MKAKKFKGKEGKQLKIMAKEIDVKANPNEFGYVAELPPNIQPLFQVLCKEVASLTEMCAFYFKLFDKENILIINSTSPRSFKIIEYSLRTSMVFSIGRLADKFIFNNKNVNYSMDALVFSVDPDDDVYWHRLKEFSDSCKPIKKWRHKVYAHNDFEYLSNENRMRLPRIYIDTILTIICTAQNLLNHVSQKFKGSSIHFEPRLFQSSNGLIYYLKAGIEREKEKNRYLK